MVVEGREGAADGDLFSTVPLAAATTSLATARGGWTGGAFL
jgi:hypothetical protein